MQLLILLVCITGLFGKDNTWNIEGSAFATEQDEEGRLVSDSGNFSLRPGVYKAHLFYVTPDDMRNAWTVEAEGASFDGLLANVCMLGSDLTQTEMYFWLLEGTDSLHIKVLCDASSSVTVESASLAETNLGARAFLVIFSGCFILWDFFLYQKERNSAGSKNLPLEKEIERRGIVFGMVVLILVSSVPLFTGYEIASAELNCHIQRMEGVKDALLAGWFPVRIYPDGQQDYGYAVGVFSGDIFLGIPAFLRIMGFPLGASYLLYKFAVNVATVVIACESFGRILKSRLSGLFAAALYTLNTYRLAMMYEKDYMGLYTAAIFLPLFACGIWRLLSEETGSKAYGKVWILPALGLTGLIQSHMPTCRMALAGSLCIGVLLIKRVLRRETLSEIAKAFIAVFIWNFWFIVPYSDIMMTQRPGIKEEMPLIMGAAALLSLGGGFILSYRKLCFLHDKALAGTLAALLLAAGLFFSRLLSETPFYKIYENGYRGVVYMPLAKPGYWQAAEAVSAAGILIFAGYIFYSKMIRADLAWEKR